MDEPGTIAHDGTERTMIEEALRESARRIALILENVSDAFCALDHDWMFVYVNREAERLLHHRRTDLIGRGVFDVFPHIVGTQAMKNLERARADHRTVDFEEWAPGLGVWLEVRVHPSESGLSIYFRDITARRRQEIGERLLGEASRLLAESLDYEATLEQVVRLAVPALADWSLALLAHDGCITRLIVAHANPTEQACARALLSRLPLRFDPALGLGKVLKRGEPELLTELPDSFLRGVASSEEELAVIRRLGLGAALVVPLRTRGRVLGALALLSSTSQRRYEIADLALAEELGRRAALAVDNARLYREAQAAVRAREDMISIATHDIKGPITSLKLRAEMLLGHVKARGDCGAFHEIVDGLEMIRRRTDQLGALVNFLLESSRIVAGRIDLKLSEVDLSSLAWQAIERFQEQLAAAGSTLALTALTPQIGLWDHMRLEQVVSNLLSNAVKFGQGKPIEVTVEGDEEVARLTIRDHGIGIPSEDHGQLFERFQRGTGVNNFGGTGFGLYIVRKVIDALGGTIRVESEPGEGARFTVELPKSGAKPS